jgi:hypothetical protein
MTTEPPGLGRHDPDAAANRTPGANRQRPASSQQPPWPPTPTQDETEWPDKGWSRPAPAPGLEPTPAQADQVSGNGHIRGGVSPQTAPLSPGPRHGAPPGGDQWAGGNGRTRAMPPAEQYDSMPQARRPPGSAPLPAPVAAASPTSGRASHKARERRSSPAPLIAPPLADADGHDLRPDPLAATTPAELMKCARQFHIWAGNLGLRVMARHIGRALSAQTLSTLLRSEQLPRQSETMRLLIEACGGDLDDQRRFVTAWRRLMLME